LGYNFPLLTLKKDGCDGDDDLPPLQKNNDLCRSLSLLSQTHLCRTNHARTVGNGSRIALWHERHVAAIGLYRWNVVGGWNFVFHLRSMALTNNGKQKAESRDDNDLFTTKAQMTQRTTDFLQVLFALIRCRFCFLLSAF
jgi:hypothetical protein